jgi:hypothetical protein
LFSGRGSLAGREFSTGGLLACDSVFGLASGLDSGLLAGLFSAGLLAVCDAAGFSVRFSFSGRFAFIALFLGSAG